MPITNISLLKGNAPSSVAPSVYCGLTKSFVLTPLSELYIVRGINRLNNIVIKYIDAVSLQAAQDTARIAFSNLHIAEVYKEEDEYMQDLEDFSYDPSDAELNDAMKWEQGLTE